MNSAETKKLLLKLQVGWSKTEVTDDLIEFYQWGLADLDAATVNVAAQRWVQSGKPFFPAVSDLREMLADAKTSELRDDSAWSEVQKQIKRCGFNRPRTYSGGQWIDPPTPEWSHPLIEQAVNETGWKALCLTESSSGQAELQKKFYFTLKDLKERAKTQVKLNQSPSLGGTNVIELGAGK